MDADLVEALHLALGCLSEAEEDQDEAMAEPSVPGPTPVVTGSNPGIAAPASPLARPANSGRSRPKKKKPKAKSLTIAQRKKISSALESTDGSAFLSSVFDIVSAERHMSIFPTRLASFQTEQSLWETIISKLLQDYRKLYEECSTKADKFALFQIKWSSNVRAYISSSATDIAATKLNEDDRTAVVIAIGAAVWKQCTCIIKSEIAPAVTSNDVEPVNFTDTHTHRFFGWALSSCIDLLKANNSTASAEGCEMELSLLRSLCVENASKKEANIPASLSIRDRGYMRFLKQEHMEFAHCAMEKMYAVVNADAYSTYGRDLVKVASPFIEHDKTLPEVLMSSVVQAHGANTYSEGIVHSVAGKLLKKVLNALCDELIDSTEQMQLQDAGRTSSSGLNLRDRLHVDKA